jgi:hypothetical protein
MDFTRFLHRFTVVPSLHEELAPLQRIAYNLWWCWEPEAIALFKRIDLEFPLAPPGFGGGPPPPTPWRCLAFSSRQP